MSADLRIEAPTDAQLRYIADLCREQGLEPPPAVHSKQEASAIIYAISATTYRPEQYEPIGPLSEDRDLLDDYEDVPF